jgi:WD40 repeat protein
MLVGHSDNVYSVAVSPDGQYIASGSRDQTVRLWSAKSGQVSRQLLAVFVFGAELLQVLKVLEKFDNSVLVKFANGDANLLVVGDDKMHTIEWKSVRAQCSMHNAVVVVVAAAVVAVVVAAVAVLVVNW